jgi:hypothetical protein
MRLIQSGDYRVVISATDRDEHSVYTQGKLVLPALTRERLRKCFPTCAGSRKLTACCDAVAAFFWATLDTPFDLMIPTAKRRRRVMFSGPWPVRIRLRSSSKFQSMT